ncbi:MAG: hypothetical protein KME30_17250 [Iphinoe sp. HA4291-MV1]|nr:hypothetical protein [Iphinoe sp. HA4291-MV1]
MTPAERQATISNYLTIAKLHTDLVSDKVDELRLLVEDIKDLENNPATRARLWSEMAMMFAGMAAQELGA